VVEIFGDDVVPFQLETLAKPLSHSQGKTAVQGFRGARGDENVAEIRTEGSLRDYDVALGVEQARGVDVEEGWQVDALREREIGVGREIRSDLLLVRHVGRVDAWILVVFAKHAHTREARERVCAAR